MNVTEKVKQELIRIEKEECQQRVLTGKKVKLTAMERELKKN